MRYIIILQLLVIQIRHRAQDDELHVMKGGTWIKYTQE